MRHAVMGFFILIMLIFAGASIYTAETKTMHQNELDSILGAAMEESMEILTVNPTYSIGKEVEGKELAADFIQNMLMRTTSKSTFEVEILTADAQKGLLDVRVTEYYRQIWGTGKAVARKTVILDDVEGKEEVFSKISFWKSYKDNKGEEKRIVKQVVVPEGILLPKEILPVENESGDEKVKGWRAVGQSENTIYTKENIGTVQAKGDMDFEAVYEKTGSKQIKRKILQNIKSYSFSSRIEYNSYCMIKLGDNTTQSFQNTTNCIEKVRKIRYYVEYVGT